MWGAIPACDWSSLTLARVITVAGLSQACQHSITQRLDAAHASPSALAGEARRGSWWAYSLFTAAGNGRAGAGG
jgi:hypothetical protein